MKSKLHRTLLSCAAAFAVAASLCGNLIGGIAFADSQGRLAGDADCDGTVRMPDAVLTARAVSGYDDAVLTAAGKLNIDVDLDGQITSKDLQLLLAYLSGSIDSLEPDKPFTETTTTTTETTTTTTETTTTTSETTTTTTTTETTTTTTETTTTTSETTTTTTTTEPAGEALIVDDRTLPLDLNSGALIAELGSPTEELVVAYQNEDMKFFVYAQDPAHTYIAIVADDTAVGYFAFGMDYSAPSDYTVKEYADTYSAGTGEVYAVQVLKSGYTLNMNYILNKSDLWVMSKLNYYGVNALRAMNGVGALNWNNALASVALGHSADMADNNYFAHNDLDGGTPKDRMDAAGISCSAWGENVDAGYTDPFWALHGWYISEMGHRNNILKETFTDLGIGFAYNANSTYRFYGTQDFIKIK